MALAPKQNGIVNYPDGGSCKGLTVAPLNRIVLLQSSNCKFVSSEGRYQAMTCGCTTLATTEKFLFNVVGSTALADGRAKATPTGFYPNPAVNTIAYQLPSGVKTHRLSI